MPHVGAQGNWRHGNGAELRRWRAGDCSRPRASTEARTLENGEREFMKQGLFVTIASILLFSIAAMAQEVRNEVSVKEQASSADDLSDYDEDWGCGSGIPLSSISWLSAEAN